MVCTTSIMYRLSTFLWSYTLFWILTNQMLSILNLIQISTNHNEQYSHVFAKGQRIRIMQPVMFEVGI